MNNVYFGKLNIPKKMVSTRRRRYNDPPEPFKLDKRRKIREKLNKIEDVDTCQVKLWVCSVCSPYICRINLHWV